MVEGLLENFFLKFILMELIYWHIVVAGSSNIMTTRVCVLLNPSHSSIPTFRASGELSIICPQ